MSISTSKTAMFVTYLDYTILRQYIQTTKRWQSRLLTTCTKFKAVCLQLLASHRLLWIKKFRF